MTTIVLGISAFYHDSAAAIVRDGEIIAAAQEERFSRKKHDRGFPEEAVNYCLEEAFVQSRDLAAVVFYENPVLAFDRVFKNALVVAPNGMDQWVRAARSTFESRALLREYIQSALGVVPRVLLADHHMSHAASAFYPSPFREAAILTVDGVGEWTTTAIGFGEAERLELLREIRYPHSLGLLYSAFTQYCGFRVNSDEQKLMGLAPYGQPVYADTIRKHLIDIKADGSFRLHTQHFGFLNSEMMTNRTFERLFGGGPREPESRITRRVMDLAASIQAVVEDVMVRLARQAAILTGCRQLVLAGGVALNCVANTRILYEAGFDDVWIQPAAGDAGSAVGAALLASYQYFGIQRSLDACGKDSQKGSLLGPRYGSTEIRTFLDRHRYPYTWLPDADQRAQVVARLLADGCVVGYMSGRMELGPRALGGRSILADPRRIEMLAKLNLRVKHRESFRPLAPAVLVERAPEYFGLQRESPYMLFVAFVEEPRRILTGGTVRGDGDDQLLARLYQPRSDIPAVTHVDYSARVQTVDRERHEDLHKVLEAFQALTGCGVLINTSFNVRGEPIVCTPTDAYRCFMRTGIDVLVLEDCVLLKQAQPTQAPETPRRQRNLGARRAVTQERAFRLFYNEIIVPLAATCRSRGTSFFPVAPEVDASSYFLQPARRSMSRESFESQSVDSPAAFVAAAAELWRTEGYEDLAAAADGLSELAGVLSRGRKRRQEVPSWVYPMY